MLAFLVHVKTNNEEKEETSVIVGVHLVLFVCIYFGRIHSFTKFNYNIKRTLILLKEKTQTSRKCSTIIYGKALICLCLNAKSIANKKRVRHYDSRY